MLLHWTLFWLQLKTLSHLFLLIHVVFSLRCYSLCFAVHTPYLHGSPLRSLSSSYPFDGQWSTSPPFYPCCWKHPAPTGLQRPSVTGARAATAFHHFFKINREDRQPSGEQRATSPSLPHQVAKHLESAASVMKNSIQADHTGTRKTK